jgi:hypothetical protein
MGLPQEEKDTSRGAQTVRGVRWGAFRPVTQRGSCSHEHREYERKCEYRDRTILLADRWEGEGRQRFLRAVGRPGPQILSNR